MAKKHRPPEAQDSIKDPDSPSSDIRFKRTPKVITYDEMATAIAPKVPGHSHEEIKAVLKNIDIEIAKILLSGKDILMPGNVLYTLDEDCLADLEPDFPIQ